MKILIVDDEQPARDRLRSLLRELDVGAVIGEATHGRQALELVDALQPDLVLLDIRMPGMDGIEVARHLALLPRPPAVIFTTAYGDHALAAFETCAVDYLLKPIRRERLEAAVGRAAVITQAQAAAVGADGAESRTHLSAMVKGALRLVPIDQVRYLQAGQKYVTVVWTEGEVLIEDSLKALEAEFPERFMRIHRNTLVAMGFVDRLEKGADGEASIVLQGDESTLAVSRRLLPEVRRRLREGP
jgi:two-component system response regulator AlgR